jgi:hypothetical protein
MRHGTPGAKHCVEQEIQQVQINGQPLQLNAHALLRAVLSIIQQVAEDNL